MVYQQKKTDVSVIGDETQVTYTVSDKDKNLSIHDCVEIFHVFRSKVKTNKPDGKILIKMLTDYGWRVFKGFDDDELNILEMEDYLKGRVKDTTKFTNDFFQMQLILKY